MTEAAKIAGGSGGLLIPLSDEGSLNLHLSEHLYAPTISLPRSEVSVRSAFYRRLANYACARANTHVFFLLKRKIVYGGRVIGGEEAGAFYLNGDSSWLGKKNGLHPFREESARLTGTGRPGVSLIGQQWKFQPIALLLRESPGLTRKQIPSGDLYAELARYPYLLPSEVANDGGEWTLTPGETEVAIDLLSAAREVLHPIGMGETVVKGQRPVPFEAKDGIQNLELAYEGNKRLTKSRLEFSVISNPNLLPAPLRPSARDAICRQVPMSPAKPYQIDRADVCYYDTGEMIKGGTLPNRVIQICNVPANQNDVEEALRFLRWLVKVTPAENLQRVKVYVFAPEFELGAITYHPALKGQIQLVDFSGNMIEL